MEQEPSEQQQALVDLGLTLTQAKTYLALVEFGILRISQIAKKSKIARSDTYQIIEKLQEKGLIEKIIATPVRYQALPIEQVVSRLLDSKTKQYEEVKATSQLLLDTMETKQTNRKAPNLGHQFILVPRGQLFVEKVKNAIENAQESIDHVLTWKRFSHGIVHPFAESMEKAWKKKLKIRFILESPAQSKTAMQITEYCRAKPFCQVRFIRGKPKTVFAIYDRKEISMVAEPRKDLPESPALWSNNSSLIAFAEDYFETLWLKSKKKPLLNPTVEKGIAQN